MIDREIRDARNKAIDDAVASMDNRMRHLFNQGFELGRKMAEKEESRGNNIVRKENIEMSHSELVGRLNSLVIATRDGDLDKTAWTINYISECFLELENENRTLKDSNNDLIERNSKLEKAWDTVLYQIDKMITFEKFEGSRQKKNGYRDVKNLINDILKGVEGGLH